MQIVVVARFVSEISRNIKVDFKITNVLVPTSIYNLRLMLISPRPEHVKTKSALVLNWHTLGFHIH